MATKQRYEVDIQMDKMSPELKKAVQILNSFSSQVAKINQKTTILNKSFDSMNKVVGTLQNSIGKTTKASKKGLTETKAETDKVKTGWQKLNKEFGIALERVAKYTILYRAVRFVTDSIVEQTQKVIELSDTFADLRRISGITESESNDLLDTTLKLSKQYGILSEDISQVVKIWVQQGKTGAELNSLLGQTSLAMTALGVSAEDASEGLTILQRVFGIAPEVLDVYISKLKNVESNNAIIAKDLIDAYRKVGGAANAVGFDVDELNGVVTALVQTLRVSGAYAGNFFKIVFAKVQRPDTLNLLEQIGVINEKNQGVFSDTSLLLQTLASDWDTFSGATKKAIAVQVGGVRRFSDFITLMDNYDDATKATADSVLSLGKAEDASQVNLEKVSSALAKSQTSLQQLILSFGALDSIKGVTFLAEGIADLNSGIASFNGGVATSVKTILTATTAAWGLRKAFTGLFFATTATPFGLFTAGAIGLISAFNLLGKASKYFSDDIALVESSMDDAIKKQAEYEKGIDNLSSRFAQSFLSKKQISDDSATAQIEEMFDKAGVKVRIMQEDYDKLIKLQKIYATSFDEKERNDALNETSQIMQRLLNTNGEYIDSIAKIDDKWKLLIRDVQKTGIGYNSSKDSKEFEKLELQLVSTRNLLKEYEEISKKYNSLYFGFNKNASVEELEEIKKETKSLEKTLGVLEKAIKNTAPETYFANFKNSLGVIDEKIIKKDIISITSLLKNLQSYKNISNEVAKTKNPFDELITAKIPDLASTFKTLLTNFLKVRTAIDDVSGSYSDLNQISEKFTFDNKTAEALAKSIFDVDTFNNNKEEILTLINDFLKTIGQNTKSVVSEFEQKRFSDLFSFDPSVISNMNTAIEAERELLDLVKENEGITDSELKIMKIKIQLQDEIEKGQKAINDGSIINQELAKKRIESDKEALKLIDNLIAKNQENLQIKKDQQKLEDTNSYLKSLVSREKELDMESQIILYQLKGKEINEEILKLNNEISEKLKDSSLTEKQRNDFLKSQESLTGKILKNEQDRNKLALRNEIKSEFTSSFADLPSQLKADREKAKEVANTLEESSLNYSEALEKFRDAELLFEKSGSEKFRIDMESAAEEAETFKNEYNEAVEASKEITSEASKLKDIFSQIGDIIQKKIFEQVADKLIEQTGIINSITDQASSALSIFQTPSKSASSMSNIGVKTQEQSLSETNKILDNIDNNSKNNTKDGVQDGMKAVIPTLVNAFATSQMFSTQSGQTGSIVGSLLGNMGKLGIFSGSGGIVGGLVGSLFGGKEQSFLSPDQTVFNIPEVNSLADAIVENTSELQSLNSNLIGSPTGFSLPSLPSFSGGSQSVVIENLNIEGVKSLNELSDILSEELRRQII